MHTDFVEYFKVNLLGCFFISFAVDIDIAAVNDIVAVVLFALQIRKLNSSLFFCSIHADIIPYSEMCIEKWAFWKCLSAA